MTEMIACLSMGKGTWGLVGGLVEDEQWSRVFLVTNEFGKGKFTANREIEFVVVNFDLDLKELRDEIYNQLKERIKGREVALNLISGIGKEHMALLSAVLKLGVGIRLVALTREGVEEI